MFETFCSQIQKYDRITIFRHQRPDGDAIGSQLGLKRWILDNFPEKEVKVLGFDSFDLFPERDEAEDAFVASSLAIVCDTANRERVDDARFQNASFIIKIDHHPHVDDYGNLRIEDDKAAATCELLTHLFHKGSEKGYTISKECASFLYLGLLTDTLSFKTTSTSAKTLETACLLAKTGISVSDIAESIFSIDLKRFSFETKLRTYLMVADGFGLVFLKEEDLKELGINAQEAKNAISGFSGIKELKVWSVIAFDGNNAYEASIRSKKGYAINGIANKYHGGGHANASGVKNLSEEDVRNLINDLKEVCKIVGLSNICYTPVNKFF